MPGRRFFVSSVRSLRQFLLHLVRFCDQVVRVVVHFQNPDGVAGGERSRVQPVVAYKITADNEDLDESRELTINGSRAVILSKNNITTIYIYLSGNIMKVESDLSSNETEQIAETIDD